MHNYRYNYIDLAANCQSCTNGYQLVGSSCILVPTNCVAVNAQGTCTQCFGGYTIASGACNFDLTCNSNSSCSICPLCTIYLI